MDRTNRIEREICYLESDLLTGKTFVIREVIGESSVEGSQMCVDVNECSL